jgi:hypothetical protein
MRRGVAEQKLSMRVKFASSFSNQPSTVRIEFAEDVPKVKNRLRRSSWRFSRLLFVAAAFAVVAARSPAAPHGRCQLLAAVLADDSDPQLLVQNRDADQNEISTDQIEKYVSVYKAMQRNRSLTVDQAAAQQGLTVEQFRDLENRVQRDDAALQQARDELQAAAKMESPTPGNSTKRAK